MKIVVLAFNVGVSKNNFTNGPGMSLYNFATFVSRYLPEVDLSIYTQLETTSSVPGVKIRLARYATDLVNDIKQCSTFHCWSGLTKNFLEIINIANLHNKVVILGPNLFDTVNLKLESLFLKKIKYDKILTVNDRLKYLISNKHILLTDKLESFVVGPDLDLWSPPERYGKYILWKGNSSHMVKDIKFAKEVASRLGKYDFVFMGDGEKYRYDEHIDKAKKAYIYMSTSLSETKGMALMEQWAAGVPSITHPKIYQHGEHYGTGIVTNKDINSYCDAVKEVMENDNLRRDLSDGARLFMLRRFDPKLIAQQYSRIIDNVS